VLHNGKVLVNTFLIASWAANRDDGPLKSRNEKANGKALVGLTSEFVSGPIYLRRGFPAGGRR